MNDVSEVVKEQVAALEKRERLFDRFANKLLLVWCGLSASSLAAMLVAHFLGPDKWPTSIDVPVKVLESFSEKVLSSGGTKITTIADALLGGDISRLSALAMTILIACNAYFIVVRNDFRYLKVGIGMFATASLISILPMLSGAFGGSDGMQDSPRSIFMEAVKGHHYSDVLESLKTVKLDTTSAGWYVLAQVAIADGSEVTKQTQNHALERVFVLPAVGPSFTPSNQALYAIESAAFGAPRSPSAIAYQNERLSRQEWANAAKVTLRNLGLIAGVLTLGCMALRRILARRVRRIRLLLAPDIGAGNNP